MIFIIDLLNLNTNHEIFKFYFLERNYKQYKRVNTSHLLEVVNGEIGLIFLVYLTCICDVRLY